MDRVNSQLACEWDGMTLRKKAKCTLKGRKDDCPILIAVWESLHCILTALSIKLFVITVILMWRKCRIKMKVPYCIPKVIVYNS